MRMKMLMIVFVMVSYLMEDGVARKIRNNCTVEWYAPFFSGGGYCSEAISFASGIDPLRNSFGFEFIIRQHGDSVNFDFVSGLTGGEESLLREQSSRSSLRNKPSISICHSEPGAWHAPSPAYHTQHRCPSASAAYKIGRTMFETDRLPSGWPNRLNLMDEIWVPTEFARKIFEANGVSSSKLQVVGEAVDTVFYAPPTVNDIIPNEFGHRRQHIKLLSRQKLLENSKSIHLGLHKAVSSLKQNTTVFLFIGKWETRKGIPYLLQAMQAAFGNQEDVQLWIVTAQYHSTDKFDEEIRKLIHEKDKNLPGGTHQGFPTYHIFSNVGQQLMPLLYSSANALVVPSHGEGWGRPHVEALSCGTPVVATNWSGPTEYLTNENGYPIRVTRMIPAAGWQGHHWAEIDVEHLRDLLLEIYRDPASSVIKGNKGRLDMIAKYSLPTIAEHVLNRLSFIRQTLFANHGSDDDL